MACLEGGGGCRLETRSKVPTIAHDKIRRSGSWNASAESAPRPTSPAQRQRLQLLKGADFSINPDTAI